MNSEFRDRASLGLNVVLVVAAAALVLRRSEPALAAVEAPVQTMNESRALTRQAKSRQYSGLASASDKRRWMVDQLRAMGVPNKVLARVVLGDLQKHQNRYATEVSKKCYGDADILDAVQVEFDKGLDAEMRAALGEQGFRQWDEENMLREIKRGEIELTTSETDASYALWKKVRQRELESRDAKVKGDMDDADFNDAYEKTISEFNEQMKILLGNERYAKLQQTDDGAAAFRQDLAKANPSDSQFEELLKTQQHWNDRRTELDRQFQDNPSSSAYADQLKALDTARDEEYRRVLGDDAFDTLRKEQDSGYLQMKKYETIWGLDDNSVNEVYAAMKYYQKSAEDYQARARALDAQGQNVDWEGVNNNLQQFARQTQQSLQNYLGQDRFNRMQQNGVFQISPPELSGHKPTR